MGRNRGQGKIQEERSVKRKKGKENIRKGNNGTDKDSKKQQKVKKDSKKERNHEVGKESQIKGESVGMKGKESKNMKKMKKMKRKTKRDHGKI